MNAHSSVADLPSTATPSACSHRNAKAQRNDAEAFTGHLDAERMPPAQAARAALEGRPDLAGRPFGAIVSLFARKEELPVPVDTVPAAPTAPDETAGVAVNGEEPA